MSIERSRIGVTVSAALGPAAPTCVVGSIGSAAGIKQELGTTDALFGEGLKPSYAMRQSARLYPGQLAAWMGPSAALLPKGAIGSADGSIGEDSDAWLDTIRPIRCTPAVLGNEIGVSSTLIDGLDWSAAYGGTSPDSVMFLGPVSRAHGGADTTGARIDRFVAGEEDISALGVADRAAGARLAKVAGAEARLLARQAGLGLLGVWARDTDALRAAARYGMGLVAMLYAYRGLDQALPQPGRRTSGGHDGGSTGSSDGVGGGGESATHAAREAHRAIVRVLGPRIRQLIALFRFKDRAVALLRGLLPRLALTRPSSSRPGSDAPPAPLPLYAAVAGLLDAMAQLDVLKDAKAAAKNEMAQFDRSVQALGEAAAEREVAAGLAALAGRARARGREGATPVAGGASSGSGGEGATRAWWLRATSGLDPTGDAPSRWPDFWRDEAGVPGVHAGRAALLPSRHTIMLCKMFLGTPRAFHQALVEEVVCAAVERPGESIRARGGAGTAAAMAAAMASSAGDGSGSWQAGFGCTELGERLRALGPAACRQVYVSGLHAVIAHCAILSAHALPVGPLVGDSAQAAVRAGTQAVRAACGAAFASGQDLSALERAEEEEEARRAQAEAEDRRVEQGAQAGGGSASSTGRGGATAAADTESRARAATRIARSMQQRVRGPPPPPGAADVTPIAVESNLPGLSQPQGDALILLNGTVGADAGGWGLDHNGIPRRSVRTSCLGVGLQADETAEKAAALVRTSKLRSTADRIPTGTASAANGGSQAARAAASVVSGVPPQEQKDTESIASAGKRRNFGPWSSAGGPMHSMARFGLARAIAQSIAALDAPDIGLSKAPALLSMLASGSGFLGQEACAAMRLCLVCPVFGDSAMDLARFLERRMPRGSDAKGAVDAALGGDRSRRASMAACTILARRDALLALAQAAGSQLDAAASAVGSLGLGAGAGSRPAGVGGAAGGTGWQLEDSRLDDAHAAVGGMARVLGVLLECVAAHWAVKIAHPAPASAVRRGGALAMHYGSYDRQVRLNNSKAELAALVETILLARRCEASLRSAASVLGPAIRVRGHSWTQRLVHGLLSEQMAKAADKGADGIRVALDRARSAAGDWGVPGAVPSAFPALLRAGDAANEASRPEGAGVATDAEALVQSTKKGDPNRGTQGVPHLSALLQSVESSKTTGGGRAGQMALMSQSAAARRAEGWKEWKSGGSYDRAGRPRSDVAEPPSLTDGVGGGAGVGGGSAVGRDSQGMSIPGSLAGSQAGGLSVGRWSALELALTALAHPLGTHVASKGFFTGRVLLEDKAKMMRKAALAAAEAAWTESLLEGAEKIESSGSQAEVPMHAGSAGGAIINGACLVVVAGQMWLREMALDSPEAVQVPIEASIPFLAVRAVGTASGLPNGPSDTVHAFATLYDAAGRLASEGLRSGFLYEEAESEAFLAFDRTRFDLAARLYSACRHVASIDVGIDQTARHSLAGSLASGVAAGLVSRSGNLVESAAVCSAAEPVESSERSSGVSATSGMLQAIASAADDLDDRPPAGLDGAGALAGASAAATAGVTAAARRIVAQRWGEALSSGVEVGVLSRRIRFGPSVSGVCEGLLRQDLRLVLEALEAGTAETMLEYEIAVQVLRQAHHVLCDCSGLALPPFETLLAEQEGRFGDGGVVDLTMGALGRPGRSARRRLAGRASRHMVRVITLDVLPNYVFGSGSATLAYDGDFVLAERRQAANLVDSSDRAPFIGQQALSSDQGLSEGSDSGEKADISAGAHARNRSTNRTLANLDDVLGGGVLQDALDAETGASPGDYERSLRPQHSGRLAASLVVSPEEVQLRRRLAARHAKHLGSTGVWGFLDVGGLDLGHNVLLDVSALIFRSETSRGVVAGAAAVTAADLSVGRSHFDPDAKLVPLRRLAVPPSELLARACASGRMHFTTAHAMGTARALGRVGLVSVVDGISRWVCKDLIRRRLAALIPELLAALPPLAPPPRKYRPAAGLLLLETKMARFLQYDELVPGAMQGLRALGNAMGIVCLLQIAQATLDAAASSQTATPGPITTARAASQTGGEGASSEQSQPRVQAGDARRPAELVGRFLTECRGAIWRPGNGPRGTGEGTLGWAWGGAAGAAGLSGQLRSAYDHPRSFARLASALCLAACLPHGGAGRTSPWQGARPVRQGYQMTTSASDLPSTRFGAGLPWGLAVLLHCLGHKALFAATDVGGQLLERAAAEDLLVSRQTGRAIPPSLGEGLAAQLAVKWPAPKRAFSAGARAAQGDAGDLAHWAPEADPLPAGGEAEARLRVWAAAMRPMLDEVQEACRCTGRLTPGPAVAGRDGMGDQAAQDAAEGALDFSSSAAVVIPGVDV